MTALLVYPVHVAAVLTCAIDVFDASLVLPGYDGV